MESGNEIREPRQFVGTNCLALKNPTAFSKSLVDSRESMESGVNRVRSGYKVEFILIFSLLWNVLFILVRCLDLLIINRGWFLPLGKCKH